MKYSEIGFNLLSSPPKFDFLDEIVSKSTSSNSKLKLSVKSSMVFCQMMALLAENQWDHNQATAMY